MVYLGAPQVMASRTLIPTREGENKLVELGKAVIGKGDENTSR